MKRRDFVKKIGVGEIAAGADASSQVDQALPPSAVWQGDGDGGRYRCAARLGA